MGEVVQYLHDLSRFIVCTPGKMSTSYLPMLQQEYAQVFRAQEPDAPSQGLAMIQQDTQDLPAKENQRFPSNQVYICEAIGEWGLKLDRLALMSSIMVNTNRLERRYSDVDTAGELEERGMLMIHELMRMIVDRVDFIDRQKFETRYDLSWQQEEHNQTPLQRNSVTEINNTNHVKREETPRRDTTGSGLSTPQYRSMSSDRSDDIVDLTYNQSN